MGNNGRLLLHLGKVMEETERLALKKTLAELIVKYDTLASQSARYCPENEQMFLEMVVDLKKLDKICKDRNKY